MKISKWGDFILEKKLYLFQRKFRIDDLIDHGIYSPIKISKWMSDFNFDRLAHAVFVSPNLIEKSPDIIGIRVSSNDIKNKVYFDSESKLMRGHLIEDSKIELDGSEFYLYVFEKNSNPSKRARQIHGFIYEGEVKRLNKLKKLSKTAKWDAEGHLDKFYLESKIPSNIEYWNGSTYESIAKTDEFGFDHIDWNSIPKQFTNYTNWNIKCSEWKSEINLGDFKRISGLTFDGGILKIDEDKVDNFMLVVGLHRLDKKVDTEYLILMPTSKWRMYLPDIRDPEIFSRIESMYINLKKHRLKEKRTKESEFNWLEYINEYKEISKDSEIKIRFKRDSKGQIRLQGAIRFSDFMRLASENKHIRITH